jgi:hypothetical protein
MPSSTRNWFRLARFIAKEDGKVHYGQPVDAEVDVGLAVYDGKDVKVYEIQGSNPPFDGMVDTETELTIATVSPSEMPPASCLTPAGICPLFLGVQLLSPLPMEAVGGSIRCLGVNYREHVAEAGMKMPPVPVLFMKPCTALGGPGDIPIPKFVTEDAGDEATGPEQLDYETEMAFIVSKDAKDIKEEDADEYILG